MATERWHASGPDGSITFSIDEKDQTPLAVAARRAFKDRHGHDAVTFTAIEPVNGPAQDVLDKQRKGL